MGGCIRDRCLNIMELTHRKIILGTNALPENLSINQVRYVEISASGNNL